MLKVAADVHSTTFGLASNSHHYVGSIQSHLYSTLPRYGQNMHSQGLGRLSCAVGTKYSIHGLISFFISDRLIVAHISVPQTLPLAIHYSCFNAKAGLTFTILMRW